MKLAKIPDRTPTKMTIFLPPDLLDLLTLYAESYSAAYGKEEQVADLVPAMLTAFIETDREFQRRRRQTTQA